MIHNIHDIDLIERYFDRTLSEGETKILNYRLTAEPELRKLFEQENLLVKTIRYNAAHHDLEYLRQLEESINTGTGGHSGSSWYYYAAAACIAFLVIASVFLPSGNRTASELYSAYFERDHTASELYTTYFQPYDNVFEPTLRGAGITDTRAEAFQAYDQQHYEKAAALFTSLLREKPDAGMLLLLGNANLVLNRDETARENFKTLLQDFDELDIQAKWFLSLSYLKTGEVAEAQELLRELGDTEIDYAVKARELLRKVD